MDCRTDDIRDIAIAMMRDKGWSDDDSTILIMAADIIDFVVGQMQPHSPKMNGTVSYRFTNHWPMTHCVGVTPLDGLLAAIQEAEREKRTNQSK